MAKSPRKPPATDDAGGLFGPDLADAVTVTPEGERVITLANGIELDAWHWVNRWVFFAHHRGPALKELRALIRQAQAQTLPHP
jgi:hypothetical protein